MVNITDILAISDYETESSTPGWVMPKLLPRAYTSPNDPPTGSTCQDCGASAWWIEAGRPTGWWRCCCCVPTARPADRVRVISTIDPAA